MDQQTHFDNMAHDWWDPNGTMRLLHVMNPIRTHFIQTHGPKPHASVRILEIGCGGGILTEALANMGYHVTGIDPNERLIKTAKAHAMGQNCRVDYYPCTAEDYQAQNPKPFDVVIISEVLEHSSDPEGLFGIGHKLCKPGGWMVASTINQTPTAFFKAIVAAEYVFRWVPKGTHHYEYFIKPSSMVRWARNVGRSCLSLRGIEVNPWQNSAKLTDDTSMQYIACFQ